MDRCHFDCVVLLYSSRCPYRTRKKATGAPDVCRGTSQVKTDKQKMETGWRR